MKLRDLFYANPVKIHHNVGSLRLFRTNHIPECPVSWPLYEDLFDFECIVRFHVVFEHFFDCRRYVKVFAVFFRDTPVMVCLEGGREGDDDGMRFIVDYGHYVCFCKYISSLFRSSSTVSFRKASRWGRVPFKNAKKFLTPMHGNVGDFEFYSETIRSWMEGSFDK